MKKLKESYNSFLFSDLLIQILSKIDWKIVKEIKLNKINKRIMQNRSKY
ncbi:MAG: hypothetical protein PHY80_06410 [Rickettsiales bacterium]|nr:hypothetical protein [Rickettsiales bacterium]